MAVQVVHCTSVPSQEGKQVLKSSPCLLAKPYTWSKLYPSGERRPFFLIHKKAGMARTGPGKKWVKEHEGF